MHIFLMWLDYLSSKKKCRKMQKTSEDMKEKLENYSVIF